MCLLKSNVYPLIGNALRRLFSHFGRRKTYTAEGVPPDDTQVEVPSTTDPYPTSTDDGEVQPVVGTDRDATELEAGELETEEGLTAEEQAKDSMQLPTEVLQDQGVVN